MAAQQNPAPGALSTRAETARPVLAAARADTARMSGQDGFQPLDTFEVGDNDHVPVPPEPPRESTVLAMIASAAEFEAPTDTGADTDTDADTGAARPQVTQDASPRAATVEGQRDTLATNLRDIEAGPSNPTVDIRR
ncbi:hypothetical protein KUL25_07205 [Rhodobacteraceae bacterium N5(2021)]|uniref:Uncharacterized protein n=1 Tax=Gymnodinialimonas phycosphaerae TaxID=2841589 RepID=A0A975TXY2_9RHOB|nr:hypothetical protein [Gymnodinialimonas phycosphaerae]MBY4892549.1 hypothetical protein [Gymnodinialimonas phycosphaerae]